MTRYTTTHLEELEHESIHVIREVAASFERPVLLYSVGKDSTVLLHLVRKAFAPAPIPFPLLHVNTTFKFREMIAFRDRVAREAGIELREWINHDGVTRNVNPFDHGTQAYTHIMKTEALKAALADGRYDAALGGARRDEERSRAKERIMSFRNTQQQWDPKNQRPELWNLYNTNIGNGESCRVFPISNWTELDVWLYILREQIDVVPLYFAAERPVVERHGQWIMVDDDRLPLAPNETPRQLRVRFRTLGCYPLTAAIESSATTLEELIAELLDSGLSERQGRLIDFDESGSMEDKKREGYF